MPAPAPAIMQEVIWKNDEVMSFACSLVRHALEKLNVGVTHFTTDIVPDAERGPMIGGKPGNGIAGSVVTMLKNANVVAPVGIYQDKMFFPHRAKSTRASAKTRWLNVYRLTSRQLAESFLDRSLRDGHHATPETQPQLSQL